MAMRLTSLLASLALLLAPGAALGQAPGEAGRAAFEKMVHESIEKAQTYLLSQQHRDGSFTSEPYDNALITLSLLESGLPAKHPAVQRAIDNLNKTRIEKYTFLALRLEVLVRARAQLPPGARGSLDDRFGADLKELLDAQLPKGAFMKQPFAAASWIPPLDLSFDAFQALRFCNDQGFKAADAALKKTVALFVTLQNTNGGWGMSTKGKNRDDSEGALTLRTMTGLAAYGLDQSCREGGSKSDQALTDAAREAARYLRENYWGGRRDSANWGDSKERWYFEQVYWFGCYLHALPMEHFDDVSPLRDFARPLLSHQGSEKDAHWNGPFETACALYFLAQVARPPLVCELVDSDVPPLGNRGLLAATERLTLAEKPVAVRYARARFGKDNPSWKNTPLVFIDATEKFALADNDKKNLHDYIAAGGTLLVQIHCGKKEALEAATRELQGLWSPLTAQTLRPNHPVWAADGTAPASYRATTLGLDDGVRTFAFIFQKNLIGDLAAGTDPTAMQMFRNVAAYALEGNWDLKPMEAVSSAAPAAGGGPAISGFPAESAAPAGPQLGEERKVAMAQIVPAGKTDASPLPYNGWAKAAEPITRAASKFKLLGPKPLAATDEHLGVCDLAWLSVTASSVLADDELAALKKYVAGGGFLVLEAQLGDEGAEKAAKKIVEALGLQNEPAKGSPLETGQFGDDIRGYDVSKTSVRKLGKLSPPTETELRRLTLGGKTVGVYSPLDLNVSASGIRCWGLHGYAAGEAREILANILISRTVK